MTIPNHDTCGDCHDIEAAEQGEHTDPPAACDVCHSGPITRAAKFARPLVDIPDARLNFSHQTHLDKDIKCGACHEGVDRVDMATAANLPDMTACVNCHRKRGVRTACLTCHLGGGDSRLLTQAGGLEFEPRGFNRSDRHGPDWVQKHAAAAGADSSGCLNCHIERDCMQCHAQRNVFAFHPPNWLTAHPARAEMNEYRCQTCHVAKSFCADCHRGEGLKDQVTARPPGTLSYHPSGWMAGTGPRSHAVAARTQTAACASCHEEKTCIACHGSAGTGIYAGISPHPRGFDKEALKRIAPQSCIRCHAPGDPNLR